MKILILAFAVLFAFLGITPDAKAMKDPDLEGPIVKIDTVRNQITVRNVNPDAKSKNKEKKVLVKQGMINNFKMRDYVQIRLMADNYEAKMIEKMSAPKEETATQS